MTGAIGENNGMSGLYHALGGRDGCRRLSEAFYARVARDPALSPLFPAHLRCAIDAFAAFLNQFLGGPSEYAERRWWLSLQESHLRFKIGQKERNAWMKCMTKTLDSLPVEEPVRCALRSFFEQSSAFLVNHSKANMDVSEKLADDGLHRELATRWNTQLSVEEAVAAVRSGDAPRAIALLESPSLRDNCALDRTALVSLLAIMSGTAHPIFINNVAPRRITAPSLPRARHAYCRTLLHTAAGEGRLPAVQLLLQLGADPNATDQSGHTPLYSVGNECDADGGDVVPALVDAGASVNHPSGVKSWTALDMAGRRGKAPADKAEVAGWSDI